MCDLSLDRTQRYLSVGGLDAQVSAGKQRERRRGIWQPRFWEHTQKDEDDFQSHFDYIPNNPVKHRWVKCPGDWEPSRFHRWVRAGVSDSDWACGNGPAPTFPETPADYGEPGESADE